ncbi:MAG TPA: hypothetical protein VFV38_23695, partial [Ktedonobacteraceae bacterium]|nr:hypothetical protein [Ktedonobacteraceae bacterium]
VDEPHLESNTTLLTVTAQRVSLDQGRSWQEADGEMQIQALGASFDNPVDCGFHLEQLWWYFGAEHVSLRIRQIHP